MICGTIATVIIGVVLRKIFIKKKHERDERRLKEILENARRQRISKSKGRSEKLMDDQKCVVCMDNPKEVCHEGFSQRLFRSLYLSMSISGDLSPLWPCMLMRGLFK